MKRWIVKVMAGAVCLWLTLCGELQSGYFIPYGVHNDVPLNTVLNEWGWSIAYRGDYALGAEVDPDLHMDKIFAGVTGDYVMLAAIRDGSETIDVLAAALFSEVTTYTPLHDTHASNGAEWYYNGASMGFAGLGDTIFQNTADTNGLDERDRLSWHTWPNDLHPAWYLKNGWRSGDNLYLNDSYEWDRLVLTQTSVVPESSTLVTTGSLLGLGLIAGWWRRRRKAA